MDRISRDKRGSMPSRSSNGPPHRSPGYQVAEQRRRLGESCANSRAASRRRHDREGRVVGPTVLVAALRATTPRSTG
jgi:hypothetical protein